MNKRYRILINLAVLLTLLMSSCGLLPSNRVEISIIYGSEKEEWLEPLVEAFNSSRNKTADGSIIHVTATPMGSIESVEGIINQTLTPTVWSPASSLYIPVANAEWRKTHSENLAPDNPKDLVLSPVVIAMWKPMAEALGWPQKPIGWADIGGLAIVDEGWSAYGYPEWGSFKFGHTHPNFSNSGLVAIVAQTYAGARKQRDLSVSDLSLDEVRDFMTAVQTSIIHYGTSTGFFANRMFERGPSYLSAAVMYENLVVAQETKRLNGTSSQLPVVAIYPKEGTFWSNHPYVILNAPWVDDAQREAAQVFQAFLLDKPQQQKALEYGFRPSDPSIPFTAPLDAAHGIDTSQPKTVLEIPREDVIRGIEQLWERTKKPVDLVIAIDTSNSMNGRKIAAARTSLVEFINLLDDRDRLQVIGFNTNVYTLTPLSELGEKRSDITTRVSAIIESGNTSLYDGVKQAFDDLKANGNPKHIRAVVVLSDGMDTASYYSLSEIQDMIGATGEDSGDAIKLFTIAYGDDADEEVLKNLAEITGGRQYKSDPETIYKIYSEIATFF